MLRLVRVQWLACALWLSAGVFANVPAAGTGDGAYPGTLSLDVDLRDTAHRVYRVEETIPVVPGPLVLLYPQWIPGEHGPTGTIEYLAGLRIRAGGRPIAWRRDPLDIYALHIEVPPGNHSIELSFQYLSPGPGGRYGKSLSATPDMTVLEWNQVVLYPAGYAASRIQIEASVELPESWGYATALTATAGGVLPRFQAVSLETLVDSPLSAGRNFRQFTLATEPAPVRLDIVADQATDLIVSEEQLRQQRNLVAEAYELFGARHFAHYDFLLVLTDYGGHFGLEHLQSSDDRLGAAFFTDRETYLNGCTLLTHEFVHSWNGKYRRPIDLVSANFVAPMQGDLLWVYEGLATYWGTVLATRAGMRSFEQFRDDIALMAARMEYAQGRAWRPLQDTADEAQVLYNARAAWANWSRGTDFYPEGALIWLDADTLIRAGSRGERSLDDFARLFFGGEDGQSGPRTYTFDDIVGALDRVYHFDWAGFLRTRLDRPAPAVPVDGITRAGWTLQYTEEPSALFRASERARKNLDLSASIGLLVDTSSEESLLKDVIWNSPAFRAGLAPGMALVAVNGIRYSPRVLKDAIHAARSNKQPIELLIADLDHFRTVAVDYHDGLRYPHLARAPDTDERLWPVVRPRK